MKHSMLATVLLAAAAAQAQDVPKIDPQRLSQDVKTLASDEFEGRGVSLIKADDGVCGVRHGRSGAGCSSEPSASVEASPRLSAFGWERHGARLRFAS